MKKIFFAAALSLILGCGAKDQVDNAIDAATVKPQPIDKSITGVNAFANDSRFGSISAQFGEVKNTLGLNFVRVLFDWNDGIQSSPSAAPDFSFYDSILAGVPAGVDVLAVVTGLPSWMSNRVNWIDGDPRKTFVTKWVQAVASHYAGNGKLSAIEIWNEPNMESNPDNTTLGIATSPANYAAMLTLASSVVHQAAPGKKILNAASTSINQDYPNALNYDKSVFESGGEGAIDIYAVHYYGEEFNNVLADNGVADFLNSVSKPIWVTESGAQGVNNQLQYVETAWPFLKNNIPGIARFYYYQFTEATDPSVTYGLRNLSAVSPVSDLYVYLRDTK